MLVSIKTQRYATMDYWTIKQLCDRWQVSEGTVRRWLKVGDLSAVKVGRQLRFTQDEVTRYEATFSAKGKVVQSGLDGEGTQS